MNPGFWKKIITDGPTFCWSWIGSKNGSGYGVYSGRLAHRISYEIHNGPIRDGLFVCHRCDNRECVNPDHLFLGTAYDNNRDRADKRRKCSGKRPVAGRRQMFDWQVAPDTKTLVNILRMAKQARRGKGSRIRPNFGQEEL